MFAMHLNFPQTAALFSDPARASMLMALLGGIALPAGQLALTANVSPQTASSHLSKLTLGELLSVEQQGRHRYYRLANAEVAAAIEALLAISSRGPKLSTNSSLPRPTAQPGSIAYARTCYSHLAGQLAVKMAEKLESRRLLIAIDERGYKVTARGREWFQEIGVQVHDRDVNDPRFARRCLDWTERRHHLAGRLGAAMLSRLRELKWVVPLRGTRAVRITLEGQRKLDYLLPRAFI